MGQCCKSKLVLMPLILFFGYNCLLVSPIHQSDQQGYTPSMQLNHLMNGQFSKLGQIRRRDVNAEHHRQIIKGNPCKHNGTCESNKEPGYIPICYCDNVCSFYHDCCHDVKQLPNPNVAVKTGKIKYMTCETKTLLILNQDALLFGIYMVSKCPPAEEYNNPNISDLCRTMDVFPVTSEDGLTYKNMYCASCHGHRNILVWTMAFHAILNCTIHIMSRLNLTFVERVDYITKNCKLWFIPPKWTVYRFCVKSNMIDYVTDENNLCLKYQNPVSIAKTNKLTKRYYRNVHCYKGQLGDKISCIDPLKYAILLDAKGFRNVVLTGLFYTRLNNRGIGENCEAKKQEHFVPITCNNCVDQSQDFCVEELLKNYDFKVSQTLITNDIIEPATVSRLLIFIFLSWPVQKYDLYLNLLTGSLWCSENISNPCCTYRGKITITIRVARSYVEINSLLEELSNMDWTYTEHEGDKSVTVSKVDHISEQCLENRHVIALSGQNFFEKIINMFQRFHTISSDYIPISVNGTINVTDIFDRNSNFIVHNWKATYKENTNASLTNGTASGFSLHTKWRPKSILTYVTLGLSCLSLLVTMSIYQHLGLFQSYAGKISRHMMLSLFSAQLIFITAVGANFIYEVCLTIGVLSHYLWLCTFTWMSVFCVEVLRTMRNMKNFPGSLILKSHLSYRNIILCYILPAGFVVPCALLDILTDLPIKYTGEICFISGYPANLLAFTLPVLMSILTNIIALVTSSVLISRYNHTIKSLNTIKVTRSLIPLYIRSCVLCAFPWTLGIISSFFYSDFLDYVFVILAGSHGIFVSGSFMSTKSVIHKIRLSFQKKSENSRNIELNESAGHVE